MDSKLVEFQDKEIHRTLHNGEWWFSVSDVVEALTDTLNSSDYIKKMRKRDSELSQGLGQIVTPLWLETEGGKIAGDAREKLEIESGDKVVTPENYLTEPESRKRLINPPRPPFAKGGRKS